MMLWLTSFGLLFIAGTVTTYWLLPRAWRPCLLAMAGSLLIVQDSWFSLFAWLGLVAWLGLILLPAWAHRLPVQRLGLIGLFLLFAAYQYGKATHALVPSLGFAFVILKAWHLIAETGYGNRRDRTSAATLAYLLFPPTAPVGPVQRYDAFRLELMRARWEPAAFSRALERLLYGYCKVVLLAHYLLGLKLNGLRTPTGHPWLDSYLGLLGYGLDLYLQFSGYSDIAIGFAGLLGIRVPENFNFPFAARSLPDFWRRWHITVSEWCRDFVFRPVFSRTQQYVYASVCSMIVLGLWHELSLRYLAWGLFHGVGMGIAHLWSRHAPLAGTLRDHKAWRVGCWFLTLQFVIISFAFTSNATLQDAAATLCILTGVVR